MPKPQEKRRYSGQSFADRQASRRERLIRAALEVVARFGLEGTSVAAICAEAGLTARYFYESFSSREAIFVEAYRMAQDELLKGMAGGSRGPNAALKGFFVGLFEHPGAARVFLVDLNDRGPTMRDASREGAWKLAKAFGVDHLPPLFVVGILGGIVNLARRWIESDFAEPIDTVVAIAARFVALRE